MTGLQFQDLKHLNLLLLFLCLDLPTQCDLTKSSFSVSNGFCVSKQVISRITDDLGLSALLEAS